MNDFRRRNPTKRVDARENATTALAANTASESSFEITGRQLLGWTAALGVGAAIGWWRLWLEIWR